MGLRRMWELAVMAPLGGRPDHPAKWVLLKDDERARRFIIRHGPLFQENKGAYRKLCPRAALIHSRTTRTTHAASFVCSAPVAFPFQRSISWTCLEART